MRRMYVLFTIAIFLSGCVSSTLNLTTWEIIVVENPVVSNDLLGRIDTILTGYHYEKEMDSVNSGIVKYRNNRNPEQVFCLTIQDGNLNIEAVLFKPALVQSYDAKHAFSKIKKEIDKNVDVSVFKLVSHKEYQPSNCS